MIEILISGLAVFSTRHNTTWLWPVRPIQTRCLTRSSPSCRRKTSTSHRKGKNSRYLPVFWLVCSLLDQILMFPHCFSEGILWSVKPGVTSGRWRWRLNWRCVCCKGQKLSGSAARGWRETLGYTSIWWRTFSPHPVFEGKQKALSYY